jgi:hypothetical protein
MFGSSRIVFQCVPGIQVLSAERLPGAKAEKDVRGCVGPVNEKLAIGQRWRHRCILPRGRELRCAFEAGALIRG